MPSTDDRPNILLLMTDEHRGDALGIEGHPVLQTPYLDSIGGGGFHFRRAYSASPVCVPARRTLMTGTKASTHGVFMNYNTHLDLPTLPGTLSQNGYQTHWWASSTCIHFASFTASIRRTGQTALNRTTRRKPTTTTRHSCWRTACMAQILRWRTEPMPMAGWPGLSI